MENQLRKHVPCNSIVCIPHDGSSPYFDSRSFFFLNGNTQYIYRVMWYERKTHTMGRTNATKNMSAQNCIAYVWCLVAIKYYSVVDTNNKNNSHRRFSSHSIYILRAHNFLLFFFLVPSLSLWLWLSSIQFRAVAAHSHFHKYQHILYENCLQTNLP